MIVHASMAVLICSTSVILDSCQVSLGVDEEAFRILD